MPERSETRPDWLRRFGWLALIWLLSIAALAAVAFALRLLMNAAGLTAP